jgi:DNA-binding winged helix-turn-helix (wHTH) protein
MRLTFFDCVFDSGTREVFRAGVPAAIPPKAFQLLEILITRRPNAVSKEQLHELLWPNAFVSDANLPNLVAELRAGLGDQARHPRVIRTVPRFGYAFCAEAVPIEPGRPARFSLIWADRAVALREGGNILGREPDAAVSMNVTSVSRRHARIVVSGNRATLEDLGSKNGTFLQDEAVTTPRPLSDGDSVRIGTVEMTFRRNVEAVSTESVRDP